MLSSLLWFGLIAAFFFLMMRGGCGSHVMGHGHHDHAGGTGGSGPVGPAAATAIDPVCGMQVETATAKTSVYRGTAYYFCSSQHRDAFENNPDSYLNRSVPMAGQQGTQTHG